jgi:ABC-type dipeptide/oligopeptide/nickel transport system ATPase component
VGVDIRVRSNDRVAVVGQTESGKTFLVQQLVRTARRLVVADPKGTLRGKWRLEEWSDATRERLLGGEPVRIRIPAPLVEPRYVTDVWDGYFRDVYDAGNCLVDVDEVYGVVPTGKRPGMWYQALYTRGRELGIGAIACSQRPSWIPLELISEAAWFFCFRLMLLSDRQRMSELMGPRVLESIPPEDVHGFWTYHVSWREPVYTDQLVVKRGAQ